jgi:hypothetical protein
MCPVPEGARVASPDGSHRQRPSRAEDRLSGNRLPAQTCRRPGVPLSDSAAFPARATVFGRVIGSYAGSVASISARGRAAMGVPLLRRGQIAVAVVHRDAGLLGQMHPGRQILRPGAR